MISKDVASGTVGREIYEVGQRACIAGRGTSAVIHRHGVVERFTKTLMIVKVGGAHGGDYRYRIGESSGLEIGHGNGYGGTYVASHCQRPKKS